jgi:hypothetical protein
MRTSNAAADAAGETPALVAVGGLVFGLCGACTGAFLVGGLVSSGGSGLIGMALLIGVAPTVIGFVLLRVGLRMYRANAKGPADAPNA